jgi:hypothetical protein
VKRLPEEGMAWLEHLRRPPEEPGETGDVTTLAKYPAQRAVPFGGRPFFFVPRLVERQKNVRQ